MKLVLGLKAGLVGETIIVMLGQKNGARLGHANDDQERPSATY